MIASNTSYSRETKGDIRICLFIKIIIKKALGSCPANPYNIVDHIKTITKADRAFLTLEQYRDFKATITDIRDIVIFDILFYTGVRRGELLALTFGDIDLDNKTISINKTKSYANGAYTVTPPKTLSSVRSATLPDFLIDELKNYMAYCYDASPQSSLLNATAAEKACQFATYEVTRFQTFARCLACGTWRKSVAYS